MEGWFEKAGPLGWAVVLGAVAVVCVLLGTGEQLAFVYYSF